jgi:hypothetical protein
VRKTHRLIRSIRSVPANRGVVSSARIMIHAYRSGSDLQRVLLSEDTGPAENQIHSCTNMQEAMRRALLVSNAEKPPTTALPDTKPTVSSLFIETLTEHRPAEHTSTSYTSWFVATNSHIDSSRCCVHRLYPANQNARGWNCKWARFPYGVSQL